MTVNGFQDFINKFGNDSVSQFNPLLNCSSVVNRICNCQKQRKAAKVEECTKIYINTVQSLTEESINYLKTKTSDTEIIFYYAGSHEIKRIKLH